MAAYYDYIPGAVNWRTTAFDPSNEIGTFLSYKLTDWVNKIGDNYAQIWTNHEEWEASDRYTNGQMTDDDDANIEIRLLGRDYRAGTLTGTNVDPWFGVGFERVNSNDRFRLVHIQRPNRVDEQLGYTRENLSRDTFGHITGQSEYSLSDNYYTFQTSNFTTPRITRVLYSDTPGSRYFAWQINGNTGLWLQGIIHEAQVRPDLPPGSDFGWVITSGYQFNALTLWNPSDLGNYRYYYNATGTRITQNYAPGQTQNANYARPILYNSPAIDYHGDIIGYCNGLYYGGGCFEENFTYRIGGKKYFAWTDNVLLPID